MSRIPYSKILALFLAAGYVWWLLASKSEIFGKARGINCIMAGVAILMIWFPETLGQVTGLRMNLQGQRLNKSSPGCAVAALGWVILLGFPLGMYVCLQGM